MNSLETWHRRVVSWLDGWEMLRWDRMIVKTDGEVLFWVLVAIVIAIVIANIWIAVHGFRKKDHDVVHVAFPGSITVTHYDQVITATRFWDPVEGYGYPCPIQAGCKLVRTPEGLRAHLQAEHHNYGRVSSEAIESEA